MDNVQPPRYVPVIRVAKSGAVNPGQEQESNQEQEAESRGQELAVILL
jgi:hypothetical protein